MPGQDFDFTFTSGLATSEQVGLGSILGTDADMDTLGALDTTTSKEVGVSDEGDKKTATSGGYFSRKTLTSKATDSDRGLSMSKRKTELL